MSQFQVELSNIRHCEGLPFQFVERIANLNFSFILGSPLVKLILQYIQNNPKSQNKTRREKNACLLIFTSDNKGTVRVFTGLENRKDGLYVWGLPGGRCNYNFANDTYEDSWDCAQREFREEIGVSFPPAANPNNADSISFEFAKFNLKETRYYCWFTTELLYKGYIINSHNNETLFADWVRDTSLIKSIRDVTVNLDITPRDMNGIIPLPGKKKSYRIRKCFSDDFKEAFNL